MEASGTQTTKDARSQLEKETEMKACFIRMVFTTTLVILVISKLPVTRCGISGLTTQAT